MTEYTDEYIQKKIEDHAKKVIDQINHDFFGMVDKIADKDNKEFDLSRAMKGRGLTKILRA